MNLLSCIRIASVTSFCITSGWSASDGRRVITEKDLYSFQWIADPRISPDGSEVAYTHVTVSPKHDGYDTALWIVSTGGNGAPRQLTAGKRDTQPRWSPDGHTLAFLRAPEQEGKTPPPQIFLLPMGGGEARQLTDIPKGAGAPNWSPDGKTIAFTSTTLPADFETPKDGEQKSDVRVITRAMYRTNGIGYSEPDRPEHIWTVSVPAVAAASVKARQITSGEFSETETVWSGDATKLYFTSDRVREPYYEVPTGDIYEVSAAGGVISRVTSIGGPAHSLSLSPDGARLAFIGSIEKDKTVKERSYSQPDLFVAGIAAGSEARILTTNYDFDIGSGVGGDQAPPRGSAPSKPFWNKDGHYLYVVAAEQGRANLQRVDTETGRVEPLTRGNQDVSAYSSTPDGSKAAVLISTPTNIGDLFIVDAKSGEQRQLTHVNAEVFSHLKLTEPEMIWYRSFDGKKIQAWVQRPPDFETGKKYPMILDIHGGPHSAYGYTFDHEFQWMAAKGYVVLYPNPRGSTSYGQDFGNVIQFHYPGDDFKDLMAGVDDVIARGWVDPDRLGVTGGSGGGVLTNWAIGHTNRFKAAVSQRSIADWTSFWYAADFTQFTGSWFRGAPWEQEADFRERSPITYVTKINTPLMLIEGESDLRTPPATGGEQMFRALKYLRKPVVMVRFPGETHELSRSGKPVHRVERLEHIVGWFDKYLQGGDTHIYDTQ